MLYIKESQTTPLVNLDEGTDQFKIYGRSISEKSFDFYKPLLEWVADYSKNPKSSTSLEIKLEYINTYSSKCLVDIFKKLEEINQKNYKVQILWLIKKADEEMKELGQDYQSIIDIPMDIVELSEI